MPTTKIATVGIDLGKNIFHLTGLDERGSIVIRQKSSRGQLTRRFVNMLPDILGHRTDVLSPRMVRLIEGLTGDWRWLDARIDAVTTEIEAAAMQDEDCRRLASSPGVGPIIASAMVAAIGNGASFARGRDFGAWLGLVPKQSSTGDRTILGTITKRGNRYLRTLFVQGARAVLLRRQNWSRHGLAQWLEAASKRLHRNVLAVALANKLARIAWGVLVNGRGYDPSLVLSRAAMSS